MIHFKNYSKYLKNILLRVAFLERLMISDTFTQDTFPGLQEGQKEV